MSDDFNLNLTDVEDTGGSFDLMPVGDYELVATGWENKTSAKGDRYLSITFDVTGPTHSGRKIWETFMLEGAGLNVSISRIRDWRRSMGREADVDAFGLEQLESMLNIPFKAKVSVEVGRDKGDGTKWDDKNKIAKFLAVETSSKSVPSQSPKEESKSDDDDFDWDK